MTVLASTKTGGGNRRMIRRCTGAVRGSLIGQRPYLYVFEEGATRLAANSRNASQAGRFVLGVPAGRGVIFSTGMILPVSRCKHAGLRRQFELLDGAFRADPPREGGDPARVELAQSMLANSDWAGTIRIAAQCGARGQCVFELTSGLVPLLHQHFDYVCELDDDPCGEALPTAFAPFPAASYGALMEWYHGLGMRAGSGWRAGVWNRLNVALVFDDNTDAAISFHATRSLEWNIALDLGTLLDNRNVITARDLDIELEMSGHGWVICRLATRAMRTEHHFSDVFPPFDNLIAWCKALDDDRTPVAFSFDEEGPNTNFEAHRLGADRVLFMVCGEYSGEIHLACICSARELADRFRKELADFFRHRFRPEAWDMYRDRSLKAADLRSRVLGDPWFSSYT